MGECLWLSLRLENELVNRALRGKLRRARFVLNQGSSREERLLSLRLKLLIFILWTFPIILFADDAAWERLGPPGGMVLTLEVSSSGETVYLGTSDGHIFASTDGARHWELRGRVGTRTDTVISRLLADPSRPEVVYAAAWSQEPGKGGGVFLSEDAGRSWRLLGLGQEAVRALEPAKSDPSDFVAGTHSGVFRSKDAGQTWERISPADDEELQNLDSVAIDPRDANVIYAGTYHLPWKTIDGGKHWSPVVAGLIDDSDIMSLRVDFTNPDRLFLSACSGIYRSENRAAQWTKLQGIPYAARRTHAIVQDPQNTQTLYAATTEGLWVTRDLGETWKRTSPGDWVVNSVLVLRSEAAASARVVLGTEAQGILVSEDAGENFTSSNEGFTHQVVKQLVSDPRDAKHLLMVMQQTVPQILESRDAGHTWIPATQAKKGARESFQFDKAAVDKFYGTPWGWLARMQNGQLWNFDEQVTTWREWKLQFPVGGTTTARKLSARNSRQNNSGGLKSIAHGLPLAFSRSSAFLSVQNALLRCDQGGNCLPLRAFGHIGRVDAVQISTDGSVLTVVADAHFAISRDGGQSASWHDLPAALPQVLWLDYAEGSGQTTVYLGTVEGLYVSANEGVSWTLQQRGLPAGQVETWLRRPNLMAATLREGGLYVSQDDGKSWRRVDLDSERSRFVGSAETDLGTIAIGSQSEGILIWRDR